MLLGGGTDVDDAFRWLISNSGGGDILILRASGTDGYNDYIDNLGRVNSVRTIVVSNRQASYDSYVLDKIKNCEGLFFAGGDQSLYYTYWRDTPVEDAVNTLINNRVTVGGTSAGMAIQSQFIYTALYNSITSDQALDNPYSPDLTLGDNFLQYTLLRNVITDTHFYQRDRMGRSITFLARLLEDNLVTGSAYGIACDEETAVLISESGEGQVVTLDGNYAYFLEASKRPTVCEPNVPLEFSDVKVIAVPNNGRFDFNNWSANYRTYYISAARGRLTSSDGKIY